MRYFWTVLLSYCFIISPSFAEVTLNFKDAEIEQVTRIISEVTDKTFIIDPRVKAKITVIAETPMDDDQVYEVFLAILNVHGFAAVPSGNVIKIIPDNLAKAESTPVLSHSQQAAGEQLVTQVIQVTHVSAPQLVPLLRPLIPQQGHLVAYPNNNTLVISDRASNVNRLRSIVERIDRPNKEGVEVIMLEHASASEIARILNTLEQKNANAAAAGGGQQLSIVADERTNSILIGGDKADRLRLRTLISHLDTPLERLGNTQVIYLRYAKATELAEILRGISEGITQQQTNGQSKTVKGLKTSIQADESTNSLVITAEPEALQSLRNVIQQLDIRRAQVLVEAIIAEVSTDVSRALGLQWLIFGGEGNKVTPLGVSNFSNAGIGILNLASLAYNFAENSNLNLGDNNFDGGWLGAGKIDNDAFNFGVLLQALAANSNTNVLSTPSLLTLDNQEAEIHVGQNVPFLTGQYTNTGATTGATNPFQTIQREDIGIKLIVKPQINEGNSVKLEIHQEVSSLSASSTTATDIVTNKRTIKTTVIVEDGNLVVLGGLISDDLQHVTQKVPGLGDIPILGNLFRSQRMQKVKRNLMIFLHPVIVRDPASETMITTGKYNYMRARQLEQKQKSLSLLSQEEIPSLPDLEEFITILPGEAGSISQP